MCARPPNTRTLVSPTFFFFQAEDGIRDWSVTGVQTCALPICRASRRAPPTRATAARPRSRRCAGPTRPTEIGRASCRERVEDSVGPLALKKKKEPNEKRGETAQQKRTKTATRKRGREERGRAE